MVANLSGEASHEIVVSGMTILKRLMHRGATGNDPETGDGAGLLMKIPHTFFKKILTTGKEAPFGIAMIFGGEGEEAKIEAAVRGEGGKVLAWRDVPTDPSAIGKDARKVMPRIRQLFIGVSDFGLGASATEVDPLERKFYVIRRQIEKSTTNTYICSCSSRTIVYKGLLLATQIEKFYPDLSDPDFVSPFAIVHQRYSTNTFPSWNSPIRSAPLRTTAKSTRSRAISTPSPPASRRWNSPTSEKSCR